MHFRRGKRVWNTTDNTYTTVSGYVDSGELDLTDDIMVNGEGYKFGFGRFTATEAGKYLLVAGLAWKSAQVVADKLSGLAVYKNGTSNIYTLYHTAKATYWHQQTLAIVNLAADDYLELWVYQDFDAGGRELDSGTIAHNHLGIQRVA